MSRSYKHTPRCGDTKRAKKLASRRFRRKKHDYLLQNSLYKRTFPQWDICDYETVGYSWKQFLYDHNNWIARMESYGWDKEDIYKTEDELRREYKKCYINK